MSVEATSSATSPADTGPATRAGRRAVTDVFPLTAMQQGMLFHALSAPQAPLYQQQMVLEITGVTDEEQLRAGFADLVARHPTLRTAVIADAPQRPLQAVLAAAELPVPVTDLRGAPIGLADRRADEVLADHRAHPFDLRRPPLLRAHAVRVADDRWLVATTHHHLVIDGWSVPLLHADLAELLAARRRGRSPQLAPVPGFVEFVRWLADHPQPDADEHYRALLGDLSTPTGLGVDRVGRLSAADRDIDWDQIEVSLDTDVAGDPDRLCRERGLLPSTLVHAAWGLLLTRCTGSRDAVFGMTVSGRPPELPDAARRVGMFVNTVPVRVHLDPGQRVGDWLHGVQAQLGAARDYEQVPLGQAQRCSGIPLSRPLLETVVAFQNYWRPAQDRIAAGGGDGDVTVAVRDRRERTSLPVAVAVAMPPRHVWVRLDYDRRRLDRAVAERMADEYARLITTLAAAGPDTPVDAVEVSRAVAVPAHHPTRSAAELVAAARAAAVANPRRPALRDASGDLDRAALAERLTRPVMEADRLARAVGILTDSMPLTADDHVVAALAADDPLVAPLTAAAASAGAVLELRDPLLPGSCDGATVVVGPPVALARVAPGPVRVGVTTCPPQPALLRALLAAGATMHRVVGAPDVGVVTCTPLTDAHTGCRLGRVPGGVLVDGQDRPTPLGAVGRLVVDGRDTGLRARVGVDGGLEQTGPGDADWIASVLAGHPQVAAAAVAARRRGTGSVGWVVPARAGIDTTEVLDAARAAVPAELMPTELRVVPWLPHTGSGEVDVAALTGSDDPDDSPATVTDAEEVAADGPITRCFQALPTRTRRELLDRLRTAQQSAGRPRRRRGGPVPASDAQRQWRRLAVTALRPHGVVPAGPDDPDDPRITVRSTSQGTRWQAAPDVLDVTSLAGLADASRATSAGEPPELDHDDYAAWQQEPRRSAARERDLAHWRDGLAGATGCGWLPDPVPAGTGGVGETTTVVSGTPAGEGHWLAAVAVAVAQLGRDDEAVLGVLTRPDLPDGVGAAPGPYTRMLPVRLAADATSGMGPLVELASRRLAEARTHGEVPAEDLAALLPGPPLVSVAVHQAPGRLAAHAGVTLGVDIAPEADGHRLTAVFDRSRMRPETARALLARVAALARIAAREPARPVTAADLLGADAARSAADAADEQDLLRRWADGGRADDAPATLPELVALHAGAHPDRTAVEGPDGLLDYGGLWRRATALAARLRAEGLGTDEHVAVCLPRSTTMVWAALGVMLAGAGYVPVDPSYPVERARFICRDAKVRAVVTVEALRDRFEAPVVCLDTERLPAGAEGGGTARPESTAYVLYTSGSTGVPKGVVVEHRAVVDFCRHIAAAYHIDTTTRLLGFAALTFDVSVFDLWAALTAGATLVLASEEERLSVDRLQKLLVDREVTAAELPPSLMPLLDPTALPHLRLVSVGGEAPPGALVDTWAGPDREFWNGYGPTETTVAVTLMRCTPPSQGRTPPIGRPMPNHRAYVLDGALRPVPVGVPGELCVGGVGLARCYLGRPGQTAERFVPDPFGDRPGDRLYRTGDLVRWTPDGLLEFLGRVDRQVKLRGFRVELGEVEAVLAADERIRQVAVEPWTDPAGTTHLAAYLVPAGDAQAVGLPEVRSIAAARLPDYMVPTRMAVLDRLPLTATGKLNRSALPEPAVPEAGTGSTDDSAQWTQDEQVVAEQIFGPLLGLPSVGREDDFFALGGNSLQATQVTARVREHFGVEVSLADLFADPTVAQVARLVTRARDRAGRQQARLDRVADAPRMTAGALLPASYPQEWLWRADRKTGGNPRFNAPFKLRMGGPLDLDALRRTFELLSERHATLRVTFCERDGELMQRVNPPGPVDLNVVEVPGADPAEREANVGRMASADTDRVFDLENGPLLRVNVYRLDEEDHVVQWVIHHTATDGWSTGLLLSEVGRVYHATRDGDPSPLEPLTADYAEFVEWHRDYVSSPQYRDDMTWWSGHLDGARGPRLATDRPRAGHRFTPGYVNLSLPEEVSAGMDELTRRTRSTMYMVTLAAYAIVLGAAGDTDELTVVTPNALRVRRSWESLVGWFANRVVLRVRLRSDATFAEYLAEVRREAMAAFAHQYMPFELLREELDVPDSALAACFSVQNAPTHGVGFRGFDLGTVADPTGRDFVPIGEVYAPLGVKYECSVMLRERGRGWIAGGLEYDAGLFDHGRVLGWRDGFLQILVRAVADPTVRVGELIRLATGN